MKKNERPSFLHQMPKRLSMKQKDIILLAFTRFETEKKQKMSRAMKAKFDTRTSSLRCWQLFRK